MDDTLYNINISVFISIPIIGDESISKVSPPPGFKFKKIRFEEYEYKNNMIDASNNELVDFHFAINNKNEEKYIITLETKDMKTVEYPYPVNSLAFTDKDFAKIIEKIQNCYEKELLKYFSLLHLFKEGEVARKYSFYRFETKKGIINMNFRTRICTADMVTLIQDPMIIKDEEISTINSMLNIDKTTYLLLKNVLIDDLEYSYHIMDNVTNYKNLVTVLEILLLEKNQKSKKECLSKRSGVLLGDSETNMKGIYDNVKRIYTIRSKAVHEGITDEISREALNELRNLIRDIAKKYIIYIKRSPNFNQDLSFVEIKKDMLEFLKSRVIEKKDVFS